ncbi:MAG: beta strand repeat-containing protein, partial [Acidimicrobiales bacterium]
TGDSATVTVKIYNGTGTGGSVAQTRAATRTGATWSIAASPALAAGTYTAQATQADAVANTGTSGANTFTVDATGPAVTLTSPVHNSRTSNTTPALSGVAGNVAGDSATVTVRIYNGTGTGGAVVQTIPVARTGGTWTTTAAALADGTYTAQATQTDAANTGTSSANTFTVDTVAPAVTVTSPANGATVNDTTPTLSGIAGNATGDAIPVTVRIYNGSGTGGSVAQTLTPNRSGGTWTTTAATLAAGTYTAQATQVDDVGHTGTSAANTFTVDATAPVVTLTTPAAGAVTNSATPTLAGLAGNAAGDSATVTVTIYNGTGTGGSVAQTIPVTRTGGTWTTTAAALASGTYTAQATQSDGANTGTSTANTFTVDTVAPTPTAVTLANGGTAGTADQDDTLAVTYSEALKVSSMCSTWSGDTTDKSLAVNNDVTVTITDNGANDVLTVSSATCSFNFGSVSLGGNYVSATRTYKGNTNATRSQIDWDVSARKLTITLGAGSGGAALTGVALATPTYSPSTAITDPAGNAMLATPFAAPATSRL